MLSMFASRSFLNSEDQESFAIGKGVFRASVRLPAHLVSLRLHSCAGLGLFLNRNLSSDDISTKSSLNRTTLAVLRECIFQVYIFTKALIRCLILFKSLDGSRSMGIRARLVNMRCNGGEGAPVARHRSGVRVLRAHANPLPSRDFADRATCPPVRAFANARKECWTKAHQ